MIKRNCFFCGRFIWLNQHEKNKIWNKKKFSINGMDFSFIHFYHIKCLINDRLIHGAYKWKIFLKDTANLEDVIPDETKRYFFLKLREIKENEKR